MPGPGPHMMYTLGTGQALSRISNGRFSPHHCIIYSINAFFGPDMGSFSLWLTSTLGFGASYGSTIEDFIHHPFFYFLFLGYPLSLFYSWASTFLLHKGFLDSISGVPLNKRRCFLLIAAGSLSHFFLDHLFEMPNYKDLPGDELKLVHWNQRIFFFDRKMVILLYTLGFLALVGGLVEHQ